jgi:hypothetical protein
MSCLNETAICFALADVTVASPHRLADFLLRPDLVYVMVLGRVASGPVFSTPRDSSSIHTRVPNQVF